jgi:uncharacterized lipoprotein
MSLDRVLIVVTAGALLSGCHLFTKLNPDCHTPQEYEHALSAPPLKVPSGLDTPNTQGALVIPTLEVTPPSPGPKEACLDIPPKYQAAPANKAGGR